MMGKFFSFAGQSLSLLVLYILYSLLAALGVAYVLVTTSFQIRPITLLVLGILAWAAASQGLSFFTDYVLSLELSVYLWTYLCIGFWEAVLVIPVCSCILLIQGLISDSNNRSIGYVLNWFGDSLDGTLARVRNQQRPKYGYYLDHLVDFQLPP
ncbi:MAG: CDP-alcohol phosphatidyltransferase family protein, partial [Acidobacteriota bacterium]